MPTEEESAAFASLLAMLRPQSAPLDTPSPQTARTPRTVQESKDRDNDKEHLWLQTLKEEQERDLGEY